MLNLSQIRIIKSINVNLQEPMSKSLTKFLEVAANLKLEMDAKFTFYMQNFLKCLKQEVAT